MKKLTIFAIGMLVVFTALVHAENSKVRAGSGGWKEDVTGVPISSSPACGMAHGTPFTVEKASLQNGILSLRKGKEFFADQEFMIFLFLKKGETIDGKTYTMKHDGNFGPHVHFKYKVEGNSVPETKMFMKDYAMQLGFGKIKDKKVTGKIYLCLPDEAKSYVEGTFVAEIH